MSTNNHAPALIPTGRIEKGDGEAEDPARLAEYAFLYSKIKYFAGLPRFIQDYLVYLKTEKYGSLNTLQSYTYDYGVFLEFLAHRPGATLIPEGANSSFPAASSPLLYPADVNHGIYYHMITINSFAGLTHHDIRAYLFHLEQAGNGPAARQRKLSSLCSLFDYLINDDLLSYNPVRRVKRPRKLGKRLPVYLTAEEARHLLDTVSSTEGMSDRERRFHDRLWRRDFAMITLMLFSGIRISELVGLNLETLDIRGGTFRVTGKGDKEREIPLALPAREALQDYLRTQPLRKGPVFRGQNGRPLTKNAAQKIVKRYVLRASLSPKISAHKLRHSFATALANQGVDSLTLRDLLGHESVATTQIYTFIQRRKKEEALEKLPF